MCILPIFKRSAHFKRVKRDMVHICMAKRMLKNSLHFRAVRFSVIFMFSSPISTLFVNFNKAMHAWIGLTNVNTVKTNFYS